MNTIRRRLIAVALATTAVTVFATAGPAGADVVTASDSLVDMVLGADHATDGAYAHLIAVPGEGETWFILFLTGLDPAAEGETYGAHVHVGPCTEGTDTTGGHYNTGGGISPETEVWLDFTVLPGGMAISETTVPFVIPSGDAQSVTVHRNPTDPGSGAAGTKIACLPVEF